MCSQLFCCIIFMDTMITHKSVLPQNLDRYPVLYNDDSPSSQVFLVSQFPDIFTAGKNSFFIKGTGFLDPDTEVLVEIIDANGSPVYCNPIKNYEESLSRIISVEVYNTTPVGPGTITILGQLRMQINGQPIPEAWRNRYNVRWTRPVFIDNRLPNTNPIKVYETPTVQVSEILVPHQQVTFGGTFTGSADTPLTMSMNYINDGDYRKPRSLLRSGQRIFTSTMEGAEIRLINLNAEQFTASIYRVWNSSIAELDHNLIMSTSLVSQFSNNYHIIYSGELTSSVSQYTRSFADIRVDNLRTFSGDIEKMKVFVRNAEAPTGYDIVFESDITENTLLLTSSFESGDVLLDYGTVTKQSTLDSYWISGSVSSDGIRPLGNY